MGSIISISRTKEVTTNDPRWNPKLIFMGLIKQIIPEFDDFNNLLAGLGNCAVYSCGYGEYGNLGLGSNGFRTTFKPLHLDPGIDFISISCGARHVLALTSKGKIYSWGSNTKGQVGTGTSSTKPIELRRFIGGDSHVEFKAISAGKSHSVALSTRGQLYGWGNAKYNGTSQTKNAQYPQLLDVDEEFVSISAGYAHSLALTATGKIYAWGSGKYGQLGQGNTSNYATPTLLSEFDGASLIRFSAVSAGGYHSLALTTEPSRRLYSWGWNFYGQTAHGYSGHRSPRRVTCEEKFQAISAGGQMSLALTVDGRVVSFGKQSHLGRDSGLFSFYSLEPLSIDEPIVQISAGHNHSVVIAKSGAVYAWGSNADWQLGSGVRKSAKAPIKISFDTDERSDSKSEGESKRSVIAGHPPIQACAGGSKHGSYTFILSATIVKKENIGKKMTPEHLVYRKFKLAIQCSDKERLMDVLNDSLLSERRKSKGLILIARFNKLELMSLMIHRGCSVNAVHYSGVTPLQVAAQCGSLAVLNALLHEGAEIDLKNDRGETGLHIAVSEGRLDVVKILIDNGASIFAADNKDYFCEKNLGCLETKNYKGQTTLHIAVIHRNTQAVRVVCTRGANTEVIDDIGNTPLYYAVIAQNIRLIRKLLKFNANRNAMTSQGKAIMELTLDPEIRFILTSSLHEEKKEVFSNQGGMFFKNLVFQGGGIKGLAYLGALEKLYSIDKTVFDSVQRIGGTSAGAITTVLVGLGYSVKEIREQLMGLDFEDFLDGRHKEKFLIFKDKKLTTKRVIWEFLFGSIRSFWRQVSKNYGLFRGDVFRDWIESHIFVKTNRHNTTFRELNELREEGKTEFKDLYFVGTNLTKMEAEVFSFETTPDMVIADAVRISMSIPFLFVPHYRYEKPPGVNVPYKHPSGYAYIDGGLIDNYPVTLFDKAKYLTSYKDNQPADLPVFNTETLGFRLIDGKLKKMYESQESEEEMNPDSEIDGVFAMIMAVFGCIYYKQESDHLHSVDSSRTVYIDHFNIGMVDFDLTEVQKNTLIATGKLAVEDFLTRMRHDSILRRKSHFLTPKLLAILAKYFKDFEVFVVNGHLEVKNIFVSKTFTNSKQLFYEYTKLASDTELLLLKDLGLSIYAKDEKGNTALHDFAQEGDFASFERLWSVEPFKNIDIMNAEGSSILDMALKCEDIGKSKQTVTSLVLNGVFKCRSENVQKVSVICQLAIESGFGGLEEPLKSFRAYVANRENLMESA